MSREPLSLRVRIGNVKTTPGLAAVGNRVNGKSRSGSWLAQLRAMFTRPKATMPKLGDFQDDRMGPHTHGGVYVDNLRAGPSLLRRALPWLLAAFLFGFALSAVIFTTPRRPEIRIISRSEVIDIEGRPNYLIDWIVNGTMALTASFQAPEARQDFEKYLHEMGRVEE